MQQVLPFVTSVCIHAAALVIGVAFFYGAQQIAHKIIVQEPVIIPSTGVLETLLPPGIPSAGTLGRSLVPSQSDLQPSQPAGMALRRGPFDSFGKRGGQHGDSDDPIIGAGSGAGYARNHAVAGDQLGSMDGTGTDDGGRLAAFGAGGGGANGLFGPVGYVSSRCGNARKIAFVCDASGSMLIKFPTLRRQLAAAINSLRPSQSFSVVFFQDTSCVCLNRGGLVMATPENKLKAMNFLEDNVVPRGQTDPVQGLELAIGQKPELIYLLTDGDFPDNDLVHTRIASLNKDHRIKVNTIAFMSEVDTDTAFQQLLKTIAQENGGTYRLVRASDIQ